MGGRGGGRMFIIIGRRRCLGNGGYRWLIGRGSGCMRRIGRRVFIRRGIRGTRLGVVVGRCVFIGTG